MHVVSLLEQHHSEVFHGNTVINIYRLWQRNKTKISGTQFHVNIHLHSNWHLHFGIQNTVNLKP